MVYCHHVAPPRGQGHIVVAVDTSSSVGQEEYAALMSELTGICEDAAPDNVTVIYCNTSITRVDTFEDPEDITEQDLARLGGGGTSFDPPFKYVEDNDLDVDSFIYPD